MRAADILAAAVEAPVVLYVRGPFSERVLEAVLGRGAVVSVKYAVPDPVAFTRLAAAAPELTWVCGLAETWAPFFWAGGARGFTSGLGNVAPALSLALRDALRAGDADETLRLWRLLLPFERLRARRRDANNVAAVKAALGLLGFAAGPPRPPLSPLPEEDAAELREILASWGLG
jgi:4-hydroxy-tetrahydrodipicolinate synthase